MQKVALILESPDVPASDLEDILEALKPIIALCTSATVHVDLIEE